MAELLTEFSHTDMVHGVVFTIPEDGITQYEIYVDEFKNIWIHPTNSNDLTAKVDKVTKRGFYWSKHHFGTRIKGIHPFAVLRKVEKEMEVTDV